MSAAGEGSGEHGDGGSAPAGRPDVLLLSLGTTLGWREGDWPETRYERKALAAGRKAVYLRFTKG